MTAVAVGLSHSPLIGKNDPAGDVLARVDEAIGQAKQFVRDFDPELVVLYAPDHYNGFFYKEMPPFCLATEAIAVGDFGSQAGPLSVDTAAANAIAQGVLDRGIDLTISARMVVDHGFVQPLEILFDGIDRVPVIPVFINGVATPLGPISRIRALGSAFGEAATLLDKRVLFLGSGGLSHDPPVPVLDGAPPRVADALIEGHAPTSEQRERGEQRVIQAGRDYAAGSAAMIPINPSGTTTFSTSCRRASLPSSTPGRWSGWDARVAARRTRFARGSRRSPRLPRRAATPWDRASTRPSRSGSRGSPSRPRLRSAPDR